MSENLDKMKLQLGIPQTHTDEDAFLNLLLEEEEQFLLGEIGLLAVPTDFPQFNIIVRALAVVRFNRKGEEGSDKSAIESYSRTFTQDVMSRYRPQIKLYLNKLHAEAIRQSNQVRWY
jgi:hypothetical protein